MTYRLRKARKPLSKFPYQGVKHWGKTVSWKIWPLSSNKKTLQNQIGRFQNISEKTLPKL